MALSLLTSTLQALKSVNTEIDKIKPISEADFTKTWPTTWRSTFQMVLISLAVGGIELCYSAETAFVTPLLLQLGIPVYLMTLCWIGSPILGFFVAPVFGSASDSCTSKMGRRRPFIIIYSCGIVLGLILVPYGQRFGLLLGDVDDVQTTIALPVNNSSCALHGNITDDSITGASCLVNSATVNPKHHSTGIVLTVTGLLLLDFCCDACQTPCRTLMIDSIGRHEQARGLSMFTVVAGIGGSLGYTIGGISWNKHTSAIGTLPDPEFYQHVYVVFGVVLFAFLLCCLITLCSVKETPIGGSSGNHAYRRMHEEAENVSLLKTEANPPAPFNTDIPRSEATTPNISSHDSDIEDDDLDSVCEPDKAEQQMEAVCTSSSSIHSQLSVSHPDAEVIDDLEHVNITVFLKSIVFMPKYMWILSLTNLFCWMSLTAYSLHFTNFMGQSVYKGAPNSPVDSDSKKRYEMGVRVGSQAMVVYCLSCMCYSLVINILIEKLGTRTVYVCGQLVFSLGMAALAGTQNVYMAFVASASTGIMYATLFTLPYILVARYHFNPEFARIHQGTAGPNSTAKAVTRRGLGTDVAIVSTMVFPGQLILSLIIGALMEATGTTLVVPVFSTILSCCGAITALFVEYAEAGSVGTAV